MPPSCIRWAPAHCREKIRTVINWWTVRTKTPVVDFTLTLCPMSELYRASLPRTKHQDSVKCHCISAAIMTFFTLHQNYLPLRCKWTFCNWTVRFQVTMSCSVYSRVSHCYLLPMRQVAVLFTDGTLQPPQLPAQGRKHPLKLRSLGNYRTVVYWIFPIRKENNGSDGARTRICVSTRRDSPVPSQLDYRAISKLIQGCFRRAVPNLSLPFVHHGFHYTGLPDYLDSSPWGNKGI